MNKTTHVTVWRCYQCSREVRQNNPAVPPHCCMCVSRMLIEWPKKMQDADAWVRENAEHCKDIDQLAEAVRKFRTPYSTDKSNRWVRIDPVSVASCFALHQKWGDLRFDAAEAPSAITIFGRKAGGTAVAEKPVERTGGMHKRECGGYSTGFATCICELGRKKE